MPRLLSWGSPPSKSFVSSLYLTVRQRPRNGKIAAKVCPRGISVPYPSAVAGQELLHVPAHGGRSPAPPAAPSDARRSAPPPFFIRVWDGLACRLGQRFKAFHALRSPPETRAPASNFDCSGKGPEQRKIRKRVLACCAC